MDLREAVNHAISVVVDLFADQEISDVGSAGEMGGAMAASAQAEDIEVTGDGVSFPPTATMCHKCSTKALVLMDGCATCLNCGYSKCG